MRRVVVSRRAMPPLPTKLATLTLLMCYAVLVMDMFMPNLLVLHMYIECSIWVPKTLVTNIKGPIQKWVPKSKH